MTLKTKTILNKLPTGYTARGATMDDGPIVIDMMNAWALTFLGEAKYQLKTLCMEWTTPTLDLENSLRLVFDAEGSLAAYGEIWNGENPPVRMPCFGRVHPDHENRGLGTYLNRWMEAQGRAAMDRCPTEARITLEAHTFATDAKAKRLLADADWHDIRRSWTMLIEMAHEPELALLPDGISVRLYEHDKDFLALHNAVEAAFSDHYGHVERDETEVLEEFKHWIDSDEEVQAVINTQWFLAIDDATGDIAGFCMNRRTGFDDPSMGWVDALGVLRPYRKQGLGMALLQRSFKSFWEAGQPRVGLGVDADSLTGATRLYERAGMHVHREFIRYEKELRAGETLITTALEKDA